MQVPTTVLLGQLLDVLGVQVVVSDLGPMLGGTGPRPEPAAGMGFVHVGWDVVFAWLSGELRISRTAATLFPVSRFCLEIRRALSGVTAEQGDRNPGLIFGGCGCSRRFAPHCQRDRMAGAAGSPGGRILIRRRSGRPDGHGVCGGIGRHGNSDTGLGRITGAFQGRNRPDRSRLPGGAGGPNHGRPPAPPDPTPEGWPLATLRRRQEGAVHETPSNRLLSSIRDRLGLFWAVDAVLSWSRVGGFGCGA